MAMIPISATEARANRTPVTTPIISSQVIKLRAGRAPAASAQG